MVWCMSCACVRVDFFCVVAVLALLLAGEKIAYEGGDCHAEKSPAPPDVLRCLGLLDNAAGKSV
jgi:hypothetical protein